MSNILTVTEIVNSVTVTPINNTIEITTGVSAGTTTNAGIVQLTDSVSSTSTTTAATPNAVKSAYDLANSQVAPSLYQAMTGQSSSIIDVPERVMVTASNSGTAGNITMSLFTPLVDLTISQITVASAGAQVGATLIRLGLYTFDGTTATLVARTANDTTLFNSTFTSYTRSFDTTGGYPSSYSLVKGQRYGFAYIVVGASTMPTIYCTAIGGNTGGAVSSLAPRIAGVRTGQTDLLTSTTLTTGIQRPFFRGS